MAFLNYNLGQCQEIGHQSRRHYRSSSQQTYPVQATTGYNTIKFQVGVSAALLEVGSEAAIRIPTTDTASAAARSFANAEGLPAEVSKTSPYQCTRLPFLLFLCDLTGKPPDCHQRQQQLEAS